MSVEVRVQSSTNAPEQKQLDSGADESVSECSLVDINDKPSTDMTRMSSGTNEESKSPVKNRQKRMVHNEVERRRKVKINNHIFTLAKLLPNKDGKKWSKNEVLTKAIEYVQEIKESHEKLLIGKMDEVQAEEFKTLKRRIEELEKQNSQYVKLLEIAGFPPASSGCGVRPSCDKPISKVDPATIVMDDDGEISVVSPSSLPDSTVSSGKRRGKAEPQSSPKKKATSTRVTDTNGVVKLNSAEGTLTSPNSCLIRVSTPQQPSRLSTDNVNSKKLEFQQTTTAVNASHVTLTKPFMSAHIVSSTNISHPNISCTKESILGNINGGVTAVTHSLQGGPIMSTSQSSPQLQMQQTATVVSQIPMLNFGGTVNLMQGAQMQPVLTINDQGIQVIQMMATPNGQMMVNPNGSLLTSNATPTGPTLVQQGNGVQIDCSPAGPTQTLISADSAGIPVLQQTVCGGSLIAQGTQYMSNLTANPQVHLMTNSPPVIPAPPNGNVMLGASVQGAPHANTVLTLNPNSSSNHLPSALMLPNGQIIPVVREPQLPLIYQNQTQINGSLIMSANPTRNSPCPVFSTTSISTISNHVNNSVITVANANSSNEIIVCSEAVTSNATVSRVPATSKQSVNTKLNLGNSSVSAANNLDTPLLQTNSMSGGNVGVKSSTSTTSVAAGTDVNCNNLQRGIQSSVAAVKGGISAAVNGVKKKTKRSTTNRSQRSIKPKPTVEATPGTKSTPQPIKSPVLSDKIDPPSNSSSGMSPTTPCISVSAAVSTSAVTTASTAVTTRLPSASVITLSPVTENYGLSNKVKVSDEAGGAKSSTTGNIAATPPLAPPSTCPPNTMADILAQATESIFANSMSDISNSPNPGYFGNCGNSNSDNVDFLTTINESSSKVVSLPSTTFTNVLSTCTTMTSSSEPQQMESRSCSIIMDEIDSHHLNNKPGEAGRGEGGNNTADILSDLVGEVYRTANTSLITACASSTFESQAHQQQQQQPQCNVNMDNSNVNGRLTLTDAIIKTKRSSTEEEQHLSAKRNKLNCKLSTEDLTLASTTVTSSSVSFLSVSQLASSASVSTSNSVTPVTSSPCTVTFSNPATTSVMSFSIDTANSNENSPLCSISPLLNSPNKSNDIFALSSTILAEDHSFVSSAIVPGNNGNNSNNNNNGMPNITCSGVNATSSVITITPPTSSVTFPGLTNTFGASNPLSNSTSVAPTFTLPDLGNLNPNNSTDIQNNYRTLPYQHNQPHRTNFNGMINFQTSDPLGFSLPVSIASSPECFMEKNGKTPNYDYTPRSRQHPSSRTHPTAVSSSSSCITAPSSSVQFTTNVGTQMAQFNRIQTYSSIPLSHPMSPRLHPTAPSPINMDLNHNSDISCSANKNKSSSPRQSNIGGSESSLVGQPTLLSPTGINSGCLQRSGSIHHLPSSANTHQEVVNQLGQSGIGCLISNQSQQQTQSQQQQQQQQRQSHNYSNSNQRVHPINRQSPQMCPGSSPSPKSTQDHQGHSPINHRGSSNNGGSSSNANASPKLSPVAANQGPNSRSSHSSASVGHHPSLSSPAAFIHQRSPNLDPPLITSFASESMSMHNIGNGSSNGRRDPMFPPGQKQLTHPPLGMSPSNSSGATPRAAISYSAESLIQSQDNSSNNRPNCARESQSTSSSNTVLRQTTPMHNTGPMTSPHTLPFMHGSHLNRTTEDNQQVGFPYFPFQQAPDQTSHLIQLKPNHQMNHSTSSKNHLQNTQPQPNFSFSLMPTGSHQSNSDVQQHLQDPQSQQQHQRHSNYLSVGNYGQVPPPMPGLEGMSVSHKDIQVPRPPMAFPCMPPFPSSQSSVDQGVPNIRHRHSASFLTTPTNRDHSLGSSTFPETYTAAPGSLPPLSSNGMVMGIGNLVPLPIQGTDKGTGYKSRTQNASKQEGKLSKSKQSQSSKKKNQQYQIEEVNLSNSIFETGRSTTPYFTIPNLSPPRNNEGPTYIPNTNPLFNKSRAGKGNSSSSTTGATSNHSKTGDSYNTLFHARAQPGFNLNFQAPTFTVNHLHGGPVSNDANNGGGGVNQLGGSHMNAAPPPPPLVSSSSSHVPNFNLSNIFPDINAANESLNISPIKFHGNHILPPPPTSQSAMDGHSLQHSQSGPLYHSNRSHHPPPPPPPSVIHNGMTINSILSHSPHSFDGRAQMPVGINNTMTPWTWTSNIQ